MQDGTIAEIEKWLRECARTSEHTDGQDGSAEPKNSAQDQERPYWPYLETEDFWRE